MSEIVLAFLLFGATAFMAFFFAGVLVYYGLMWERERSKELTEE